MGTAIGSKFAPNYASILMSGLEQNLFKKFKQYIWLRYLDDNFCVWTERLDKLKELFSLLNEFHPSVKFTMDYSKNSIKLSIKFLDVNYSKVNQEKLYKAAYLKNQLTPTSIYMLHYATGQFIIDLHLTGEQSE